MAKESKAGADVRHWTQVAAQWIEWAGRPGHDAFWAYRDALVSFVGKGAGTALEIGCGEGRVSRELKNLGYHVTATDAVAAMVEEARNQQSADDYAVASAAQLPFPDRQFDLVMAYNVLMDIEDIEPALGEIRRVIRPDGTLFVSLVHPFRDRGSFTGPTPDAPFVVSGSYFGREHFEGEEEKAGLRMNFMGWSQPLENYMAAFEKQGFAITALREPVPSDGNTQVLAQWKRIPMFLWLKLKLLK